MNPWGGMYFGPNLTSTTFLSFGVKVYWVENFISKDSTIQNLPSDNGGATQGMLKAVETIRLVDLP